MEHVNRTTSRALAQSRESAEQPKRGSTTAKVRAAAVWSSMVELYGSAFTSAYGESPSPLWLAAISELSDDECRVGLTALAKQAREYPANLTQFVAACRPQKLVHYLGRPTTPERLMLEHPRREVSREFIDRRLAEMRTRLGR